MKEVLAPVTLALACASGLAQPLYVAQPLLGPSGASGWVPTRISPNGRYVAGYADFPGNVRQAIVWDNLVPTNLGTLGGTQAVARDVNDSGLVVGESKTSGDAETRGFAWNGSMHALPGYAGAQVGSNAFAVTNGGAIVGSALGGTYGDRACATRWTLSGATPGAPFNIHIEAGLPTGTAWTNSSHAFDAFDGGPVVGGHTYTSSIQSFSWKPGSVYSGNLSPDWADIRAVNDNGGYGLRFAVGGSTFINYVFENSHLGLLTGQIRPGGKLTLLNFSPTGVNSFGVAVGNQSAVAMEWRSGATRTLDSALVPGQGLGGPIVHAGGINDAGLIPVASSTPNGYRGFVLIPDQLPDPPGPASTIVFDSGPANKVSWQGQDIYLGVGTGNTPTQPQRWLAQPFAITEAVQIDEIVVGGYTSGPLPTAFGWTIYSRTGSQRPEPQYAVLSGSSPFQHGMQDFRVPASNGSALLFGFPAAGMLPPGEYYLAVYADQSASPGQTALFGWTINAQLDPVLGNTPIVLSDSQGPFFWRSESLPSPGFIRADNCSPAGCYAVSVAPHVGYGPPVQDPQYLTTASFMILARPVSHDCYPNCDDSTVAPVLNVADFGCFLQRFASADPYANCDGSTLAPVLNVADFGCFLQKFAAGCP